MKKNYSINKLGFMIFLTYFSSEQKQVRNCYDYTILNKKLAQLLTLQITLLNSSDTEELRYFHLSLVESITQSVLLDSPTQFEISEI